MEKELEHETKIPRVQELRKRFQSPSTSSAAPQQAVPVRRMKTPHAEMKGAVKTRSTPESMQKVMKIRPFVKIAEQMENKKEMKGAVKTRSTPESMQKVMKIRPFVKIAEQMENKKGASSAAPQQAVPVRRMKTPHAELETKIRSVQELIEFYQHLINISATPWLVVPDGKMMTPHAGASSAAPQQAVPVRRMKTPHAELETKIRSVQELIEFYQHLINISATPWLVVPDGKMMTPHAGASSAAPQQAVPVRRMKTPHAELETKIRSVQELIEFYQHLINISATPWLVVPDGKMMTPHAGRTMEINMRAQGESGRNKTEKPADLQNKLEALQHTAPPPEEVAHIQASLQTISEEMQCLMTSFQNVEALRKQDLEIVRAEMQGKISNDLEAVKRSWSEENLLDIDNKPGRTVDRNTARTLESIREEMERILTEKLTVLQSQLEASQHAATPPEKLANNQASLQTISEKMQSLMTSLQNVEASRKQDASEILEILRVEMQGKISNDLEVAKRSWSEENLLKIDSKQEELQAPGRMQGDADMMESLKKENELLHAQRYKVDVTLDADTAHPRLQVSKDGKSVTDTGAIRRVPSKKERFDSHTFVLAKEGYASGRLYWEVDVGKRRNWILGVAQETVTRKGTLVLSPQNGFWAIGLADGRDYWVYTDPWTRLLVGSRPRKIGIFLDISAKKLLFYNVHQKNALHIFSFHNDCSQEMKLFPFFSTGPTATQVDTEPLQIAQGFDDDEK
ncbi:uncharacterized protein [Anas acuta]|uniref:uncharacterized protein isoform X5 n=1 Tax=Anas acuta TaxID=28680 RepID=UPI0035C8876C